jgi:hypothetical protein
MPHATGSDGPIMSKESMQGNVEMVSLLNEFLLCTKKAIQAVRTEDIGELALILEDRLEIIERIEAVKSGRFPADGDKQNTGETNGQAVDLKALWERLREADQALNEEAEQYRGILAKQLQQIRQERKVLHYGTGGDPSESVGSLDIRK